MKTEPLSNHARNWDIAMHINEPEESIMVSPDDRCPEIPPGHDSVRVRAQHMFMHYWREGIWTSEKINGRYNFMQPPAFWFEE